ncbi:MAG TPA: hypothetical protein VNL18_01645 [Gemmatimonadales bacterium]|nr:hypothetical protein [Gemmatimonadales bacterium]
MRLGIVLGGVRVVAWLLANAGCEVGAESAPPLPRGSRVGWYVRVTGTSGGNGTDSLPWDLRTALAGGNGAVGPGDTVWIRGGTYRGSFTTTLAGSSTAPVIVRAYPGERVVIDGNGSTNSTFVVDGSWTWYWGLEIMNSMTARSGDGLGLRPTGVYVRNASNVKLINLIVHDTGHGTYTESDTDGIEIYGWIVYNGGHQNPTRSDGHGLYVKNDGPTTKVFRDNVIFNQFAFGVHAYTESGSGNLREMVFEGNVAFNNSTISNDQNPNFQLGGNNPADGDSIRDNVLYFSPGASVSYNARIGYSSVVNGQTLMQRNYVVGGDPVIEVARWTDLDIVNNTFVGDALIARLLDAVTGGQFWSGNMHHRDPSAAAWRYNGANYTFDNWRAQTGLAATDQATAAMPSVTRVFVRPNLYEPGRAHIIVFNWANQASVAVDVSAVLQVGDRYEVRNVQQLFGSPVAAGTYSGGTIAVPMSGVTPPAPIGGSPKAPVRTGPAFDVFVLTRSGS